MRYYSIQQLIMPDSFPKREEVERVVNFDTRTYCDEIDREEVAAYELIIGGKR